MGHTRMHACMNECQVRSGVGADDIIEIGEGGTRTYGVPLVACGADDGGE